MRTNIKELSKGKRDVFQLDPKILKMKPDWNPRNERPELEAHIESICLSIQTTGFDPAKPLTIYQDDDGYAISDGHCRLRAVLLAIKRGTKIETVPVITEPRGSNEVDRVAGLLTRNNGLRLEPLEQGLVYKRLQAFGWDDKRIAETSGTSLTHVKSIFDLMEASPETHAAVASGSVSATAVAQTVNRHGPAKAARIVAQAVKTAKANGKAKASGAAVKAAGDGTEGQRPRNLSEILAFFSETVSENNAPPRVCEVLVKFVAYRNGQLSPEKFIKQLGELCR